MPDRLFRMPERSATDRLGILDGLRGFAILIVVWYHLWLVSGYGLPSFGLGEALVRNGFLGVDLFFFLSGFCIALPYVRARRDGRSAPLLREFVRRRSLKIVPSYALALVIFAVAFHDRFDGPLQEIAHLVAHATFLHTFAPATFGSFSGPLWTLAIEVQFYVVFAFVAPLLMRRPLAVYAAFVAIAVCYRTTIAALGFDDDFGWINQLPAVLDVFGAGTLGAFLFAGAGARERLPRPALATLLAACAVAIAAAGLFAAAASAASGGDDGVHRWLNAWRGAFGPVLLVATLGVALGAPALSSIAGALPLRALSIVSYAAYLFNLEIAVALAQSGLPAPAIFWCGAALTIVAATIVTYAFERPIQRLGFARYASGLTRSIALPRFAKAAPALTDRSRPA
jgi:peptidoglycan/LPS O-acetylase OafA/YrhL